MKPLTFSAPGQHFCSKCRKTPTVSCSTLCEQHYIERFNRLSPVALRGARTRREKYPERHPPVDADFFWRAMAHKYVASALKRGILPKLDGDIACIDCGSPARHYEHRDYNKPLDVEPVCGSCNRLRGTAIWPSKSQFQFALVGEPDQKAA